MKGTTETPTKQRTTWSRFFFALLSLSQLKTCRCTLTRQQNPRSQQTIRTIRTSSFRTMTVRFSLWFPQYTDTSDFSDLNDPKSSVQKGVIASLFTMLCNESDVSVVRDSEDLTSQNNLCLSDFGSQPRFLQSTGGMSIISSEPELLVRRISGDVLSWSTWIMRFDIFQVGSGYYEKSVSDEPDKTFSELEDASVEAMEEDFQLVIDSNIITGQFDGLLASKFGESMLIFSSPIRKEEETFQEIKSRLFQTAPYIAKPFSAMRVAGLILLVLTETTLFALYALARRRRRKLDGNGQILEQTEHLQTATKSVQLYAAQRIDSMRTPPAANGIS